ncbi:hypothetical protein [Vibrio sagamiensis]
MPTSYELEYAPRSANQTKYCWEAKVIHDEYIHIRASIEYWF